MKYFNNIQSLSELKKLYHRLAKKYHPDASADGSNEIMAEINSEYEKVFENLKKFNNESANANVGGYKYTDEAPGEFIHIVDELIKYENITIEVCGLWLWVSGETKAIKEELKKLGLKFSKNKAAWYYAGTATKKHYKHSWSMNEIRNTYGSNVFRKGAERQQIEA